jgi:tetratricopeptide (TPR) repeat protein
VQEARDLLYAAPDQAITILDSVCADDPGEPTYRLDLADAHVVAGRPDEALAMAGKVEADEALTDPVRARAAQLAANVHYHAGRFPDAAAATRRALALATDDGEQRNGLARLRALADEDARKTLGRVLFGESPTRGVDPALVVFLIDDYRRRLSDEALGPYLLARQLMSRDPALALAPLDQACPVAGGATLPRPLDAVFLRECHRMTGETAFRAGDLERSRAAFRRIATDALTEADRLRAQDWLERIDWETSRPRGGAGQPERGAPATR